MIPDIYRDLMLKLHQKTLQNEINWKETADSNTYIVYFKDFSLTLWRFIDQDQDAVILVNILNTDGDMIDQFDTSEKSKDFNLLDETFSTARRIALKIDVAIKSIMEQLSSPSVVGDEIKLKPPRKKPPPDDDPF